MTDRLLTTGSVTRSGSGTPGLGLPKSVDEALGQPETVVSFLNEKTGLVYVVPVEEVSLK